MRDRTRSDISWGWKSRKEWCHSHHFFSYYEKSLKIREDILHTFGAKVTSSRSSGICMFLWYLSLQGLHVNVRKNTIFLLIYVLFFICERYADETYIQSTCTIVVDLDFFVLAMASLGFEGKKSLLHVITSKGNFDSLDI